MSGSNDSRDNTSLANISMQEHIVGFWAMIC